MISNNFDLVAERIIFDLYATEKDVTKRIGISIVGSVYLNGETSEKNIRGMCGWNSKTVSDVFEEFKRYLEKDGNGWVVNGDGKKLLEEKDLLRKLDEIKENFKK